MEIKRKRIYTRPEVQMHYIDSEISLVMMTGETTPPDPPRGSAAQQQLEQNNFESNPFEENQ